MKFKIEKVSTKTDGYTLRVNGFFLHSKYNPEKEAIQFAEQQFKKKYIHILFGNGLGYISKALKEKMDEESNLLIIDPLIDKLTDFEIGNNGTIIKQLTKEDFGSYLGSKLDNYNRNVTILCSPNYDKLFPNEYKELLKLVKNQLNLNIVNENTMRYFAETWQRNYINNLLSAKVDCSINFLEKKFNCPVVIASGGPSLSKQIPALRKNIDNLILIAAGSTIDTLLFYGIEPDFVISIDGDEKNYEQFEDLNLNKTHLIYSMTNHYKIRSKFHSKCFFFLSNEFVSSKNIIEYTLGKEVHIIQGGGSVANYAFSVASYISTGPIALIGQDLAYTSNKTHAENNKSFKVIDEKDKEERGMFYTKGYNNEDVLTDYAFLSMKDDFERLVNIVKHENYIYNCTEGGVKLEGYIQESFNIFCEKFAISRTTKEISNIDKFVDYNNFIEKMEEEILHYNKIILSLNKGLSTLSGNQSKTTFSNNILRKLDSVDSEIEKLFQKVSINTIIQPITLDILKSYQGRERETTKEKFDRIFKQNKELYSRLLDAVIKSKEYTVNLIEKIKSM